MKNLLAIVLSLLCINSFAFAWDNLSSDEINACNFAESADGTRRILGLNGGGFWLSNDSGGTWLPITNRVFPPNASTFYPNYIYELYMLDAAGDTIITKYTPDRPIGWTYSISEDGGETWRSLRPTDIRYSGERDFALINPHDHHEIFYYRNNNIYISSDFGYAWDDHYESDLDINIENDMIQNPDHPDTLYMCGLDMGYVGTQLNSAISCSYDRGFSWHSRINCRDVFGYPGLIVSDIILLSNGEIVAYPGYAFSFEEPISTSYLTGQFRSIDRGSTFQYEADVFAPLIVDCACEIPGYPGHILTDPSVANTVMLSTDFGHSYSAVEVGEIERINSFSVNKFSNTVYINSTPNGIYKSSDGGTTWEQYQTLDFIGRNNSFHVNENSITFKGQAYSVDRYDLIREEWESYDLDDFAITPNTHITHTVPVEDGSGLTLILTSICDYLSSDFRYSILRKSNDTASWETLPCPIDDQLRYNRDYTISHYFDDDFSRLVLVEYADNEYRFHVSLDSGSTWISGNALDYDFEPEVIQRRNAVIVSGVTELFFSNDNFSTWIDVPIPLTSDRYFYGVLVDDPVNEKLYAFFNDYCNSYDGEWEELGFIGDIRDAVAIPRDSETVLFAIKGYNELYKSVDGGESWHLVEDEFPYRRQIFNFSSLEYDAYRNLLWINTSIGLMYANVEELLSVEDHGTAFIPLDAKPISAYPNPFNAMVNISFKVEKAGPVELKLFNINGQEVATLINEVRQAGYQELSYDASSLSSGIYFLKFNDGTNIHTQKITLVK